MQDDLNENLRLKDFTREASISVSHFSEQFRRQTGQSPIAYFVHLRMRLACRLLDLRAKPADIPIRACPFPDP